MQSFVDRELNNPLENNVSNSFEILSNKEIRRKLDTSFFTPFLKIGIISFYFESYLF